MELSELNTKNDKESEGLTLEKTREILGNTDLSDEELNKVIQRIKIFCKVAYELYTTSQAKEDLEHAT